MNNKQTALGIEFGSTRIKAVLIDETFSPIASGSHDWENRLENGFWTYSLDDIWQGLQICFQELSGDYKRRYGKELESIGAVGISAMMHGYMAFNKNGDILVPFRTWRNTTTEKAANILTEKLGFNIPQRWSVAHLYQAILNNEPHVKEIDYLTTLAGFVHWKLTGQKVLGIDDASGMFPVDTKEICPRITRTFCTFCKKVQSISTNEDLMFYNRDMIDKFDDLVKEQNLNLKIENILPKVLLAGENAGVLTEEGAKLLDPTGKLKAGIPFCPPEGDAGTGMVATNAVAERTGNVSAGTSVFAMVVMEKPLSKVYPEIDIVATPTGKPVAMVHCNNCSGDLDAWVKLFEELTQLSGANISRPALYDALYEKALEADKDCGGLLSYNFYSGEHQIGTEQGRPLFVRLPGSKFTLANFMRTLLFSAMGTLKLGMDILLEKEKIKIDNMLGHGGLFKTKGVGQRLLAGALNTPVSVMEESAGEGGAWGIALLAAYMLQATVGADIIRPSLEDFLNNNVFKNMKSVTIKPEQNDVESFKLFMTRYTAGLEIEKSAVKNFN